MNKKEIIYKYGDKVVEKFMKHKRYFTITVIVGFHSDGKHHQSDFWGIDAKTGEKQKILGHYMRPATRWERLWYFSGQTTKTK